MNLFDYISDTEKQMIEYSIRKYSGMKNANDRELDLKNILRHWETAKVDLFKLFGEKLIITKPVYFQKDISVLALEMSELLNDVNSNAREFIQGYNDFCHKMRTIHGYDYYWDLQGLMYSNTLAGNIYSGPTFIVKAPSEKEKDIIVSRGCKMSKVLGKISKLYNIPGYEKFRIAHSLILNQKQLSGTLNLSIHPLDYITMSDNSCDWTSCMSWADWGSYRRGTVEMMNSPCVVVAYLTAKDPYNIGNNTWYNKKWRELFIINEDLISDIKGYPYNNETLELQVMDWLKELAEKNGMHYDDKIRNIEAYNPQQLAEKDYEHMFTIKYMTDTMYNDCEYQKIYLSKTHTDISTYTPNGLKEITVDYSGISSCMVCGEVDPCFSNEDDLVCVDCNGTITCACCGDRVDLDEAVEFDDNYYCSYCYDEHVTNCPVCGEEIWDSETTKIYFAIDDTHILRGFAINCCYNCSDENNFHEAQPTCFKPDTRIKLINSDESSWWWRSYPCIMLDNLTEQGLYTYTGFKTIEELKESLKRSACPYVDLS